MPPVPSTRRPPGCWRPAPAHARELFARPARPLVAGPRRRPARRLRARRRRRAGAAVRASWPPTRTPSATRSWPGSTWPARSSRTGCRPRGGSATPRTPTGSAATLAGRPHARIPYLQELGVTYLHLMPLLATREGDDDGGYAVRTTAPSAPSLGDLEDLRALADRRCARPGISLVLDLVLNHVAREHAWAQAARPGSARHRAYFLTSSRTGELPDAYERDAARGLPGLRPRQLHLGRRARRLGLDDLPRLPVGRATGPTRTCSASTSTCVLFLANARRRGAAARRDRVPVEAAGHQLPEPAGGARAHPGAARGGPDRLPGGGVQGRGDRRAGRPRALPGPGAAPRQGQRPRVPQQPHGAGLVDAGRARRHARRARAAQRCRRSRPRRPG